MKIWKEQKIRWLVILLPLVVLIWPYFQQGVPFTHDGENHLARFANYKVALREGQLPPRFAPNLVNHYGYPVFNFNYPLANIFSLPMSILDIHYETTFKLLVVTALILGSWGSYRWLAIFTKKSSLNHWLTIGVFLTTPFLVNLIYVRGNIGEVWALALFPWLLWLSEQVANRKKTPLLWSAPLVAAFLLSHNVSVLFGGALWFAYTLVQLGRNWRAWQQWLKFVILGALLSLWFWLPALAEKQFTILDNANLSSQYFQHFAEPLQLVTSPLSFGFSYLAAVDTLSMSIGLVNFFAIFFVSLWFVKQRRSQFKNKRKLGWLIVFCWLLLFFQTAYSAGIWQLLPLAHFIQFPWRLSLFLAVFTLPLVVTIFDLHRYLGWLLVGLLTIQLVAVWRLQPADRLHKNIIDYDLFSQTTTTMNENTARDFSYTAIADWSPEPRVIEGEAQFEVDHWTGSARRYSVAVQDAALIVEPTMYFPGWQTRLNGQLIDYSIIPTEGRIGYYLEPGEYQVETRFTQRTWARIMGNSISGASLIFWGWLIWQDRKNFFHKA